MLNKNSATGGSAFSGKKICLMLAGGTIIAENENFFVEKANDMPIWLEKMPELLIMAHFELVYMGGEKSHEYGPKFWQRLAKEIFDRRDDYNGFIVTNSPQDAVYNSIAMSFALKSIDKPVIFTGSQLPVINKDLVDVKNLPVSGLGVKANLINAVQVATTNFGGVGLIFGNRCINPVKAVRENVYSFNIFSSVDNSSLAKIDFGVSLLESVPQVDRQPELKNNFAEDILSVKYYSGMDFKIFAKAADNYSGVMIESLPLKPFEENFVQGLKKIKKPVLIYNRFYVPPLKADNLIEIFDLTKETALVKFIWALGQSKNFNEIRSLMLNEQAGEFIKK